MKKSLFFLFAFCILIILILTGCASKTSKNNKEKIVTSFYPMYIIGINLTKNIEDVVVDNMTDTTIGCLHNYTLQTSDLRKIENANIFIENGFGLEHFMDKITRSYPNLKLIDTSKAELETVTDEEDINGHVWNSIENYKKQVNYICDRLSELDAKNSEKYIQNAKEYINKINKINTYRSENTEYVISCNEALIYLLNEANLQVIPVYTDHDESSLSGGKLAEIIDQAKQKNVKAIFVDKNDNLKNAELIENETGIKIVKLDACLTGDNNTDSYINAMEYNYNEIKKTLE